MPIAVNIDGQLHGQHDALVSVFDHGFLFGEGVYEVLRTYRQRPFLFDPHMRRLRASAERIALEVPIDDAALARRIDETIAAAALPDEAYVRILVTRGAGEIVYDPAACPSPTIVVIVKPHVELAPAVYDAGVTLALVPVVRNHPGSVNPRIKSNNLLNNALAMQQAYKRQAFEALMRNHRGEICECAQSNFFVVTNGVVRTPPLDAGLLAGVTRAFVLELAAAAGLHAREETLQEEDLANADEAFLTSTTREIVPVVRVDALAIGDGRPGPVTTRLREAFRARVERADGAGAGLGPPVQAPTGSGSA
jgi:branched-chain amino acid aminotransferase